MPKPTRPIGRPTYRIDGAAVRALREGAKLSQLALAVDVYTRAGKGGTGFDVMETSAGRWEKNGTIPPDMVPHLVAALNTTEAVLQGGRPQLAPSRVDEIERQLTKRLAKKPHPKLVEALAQEKDAEPPLRELAERIATRLEAAQLSQDQHAFKELAEITGYSRAELNQPVSQQGFWMLIGSGAGWPQRTEILHGINAVRYEVGEELRKFFGEMHESDTHVAFSREKHWFQVTMHHPRIARWSRTLRFARCQPNERGLQWVSPSAWDIFWLKPAPNESYTLANFVTGFDAKRVPAECTQLRFAIHQNPSKEDIDNFGLDAPPKTLALTAGSLAELHPQTLENFQREGNTHYLVIHRLVSNLWEELLPWMSHWPLEYWSFSVASFGVNIAANVPFRIWKTNMRQSQFGPPLTIQLVEQLADGTTRAAPWAVKSIAYVCDRLNTSLKEARQAQAQSPPGPSPA